MHNTNKKYKTKCIEWIASSKTTKKNNKPKDNQEKNNFTSRHKALEAPKEVDGKVKIKGSIKSPSQKMRKEERSLKSFNANDITIDTLEEEICKYEEYEMKLNINAIGYAITENECEKDKIKENRI